MMMATTEEPVLESVIERDTLIFNYKDEFEEYPSYGREIYIKNVPENVTESWMIEFVARFGRPVQIRYFRPGKIVHVKFRTFEEACTAVESTSQHTIKFVNGQTYTLNVVHSRDFPFLVFSHFRHDFNYDRCREVFEKFFGVDHIVGVSVDDWSSTDNKNNGSVVVEFDTHKFARGVMNAVRQMRGNIFWIENQPLYVRWERIPVVVVAGLRRVDTNEDVGNLLPVDSRTKIKRIVRKIRNAYVWFHKVRDAYEAISKIVNGKGTTVNGTCVEISWFGNE